MAKSPTFEPLPNLPGVFVARHNKLWCAAIRLRNDQLCLYSPLAALTQDSVGGLQEQGTVAFVLAPNIYHNKGLAQCRRLLPKATYVCSAAAASRLKRLTKLRFAAPEKLVEQLPKSVRLVEPQGLKNGELWLVIKTAKERAWIVTDAFSASPATAEPLAASPDLLGTFPKYGVGDAAEYQDWFSKEVAKRPPSVLVPCHGPAVAGPVLVKPCTPWSSAHCNPSLV